MNDTTSAGTAHTPDRLTFRPAGRITHPLLLRDGGVFVTIKNQPADADMERLAACWNACNGIADPAALREQRDELLKALQSLLDAAPILSAEYLDAFRAYQDTDTIQCWSKSDWMKARKSADDAAALIARVTGA